MLGTALRVLDIILLGTYVVLELGLSECYSDVTTDKMVDVVLLVS